MDRQLESPTSKTAFLCVWISNASHSLRECFRFGFQLFFVAFSSSSSPSRRRNEKPLRKGKAYQSYAIGHCRCHSDSTATKVVGLMKSRWPVRRLHVASKWKEVQRNFESSFTLDCTISHASASACCPIDETSTVHRKKTLQLFVNLMTFEKSDLQIAFHVHSPVFSLPLWETLTGALVFSPPGLHFACAIIFQLI